MFLTLTTALAPCAASAQEAREFPSQHGPLRVETLATGLEHPWSVEALPGGGLIISERPGRLRILRDGKLSNPLKGVPKVAERGQGGLLDIALDPGFAENRTLYLTLAASGKAATAPRSCGPSLQKTRAA